MNDPSHVFVRRVMIRHVPLNRIAFCGGSQMTIVCVDDHPVTLKGLEQSVRCILPEADTYAFKSADDAISFVIGNGCDVLISEIELGGANGLALARSVKKVNPTVNIIFLTVCDEKEYAREVFEIRPSGYLVKPAARQQLAFELENLRY
jgi:DNA-binding NarL/FixJ family response regulator